MIIINHFQNLNISSPSTVVIYTLFAQYDLPQTLRFIPYVLHTQLNSFIRLENYFLPTGYSNWLSKVSM